MSDERTIHPINPKAIDPGHIMAMTYYVKVTHVPKPGEQIVVDDLDTGVKMINVHGKDLLAKCQSADLYTEEVKVSMTKAAETLMASFNRPLTVAFQKKDKTERVLRGRLISTEPVMGRSMCQDLDIVRTPKEDGIRLVDHRELHWLIVDGVKYTVKQK